MVGHGLRVLKYFHPCSKNFCDLLLPDPGGSSSKTVECSGIEEANNQATIVMSGSLLHSSHSPMTGIQQSCEFH